ncbi:MAG: aldehyde dehydrogenase family protein, partial [Actinomycetales bacterium]
MSNLYQVINPATESIVTDVDLADLAAVDSAIEKAERAFKTW